MRKALQNWEGGIATIGHKINNLRYADDIILLARDAAEIKTLNLVEEEIWNLGLELNTSKTKIMVIDRQHNNRAESRRIDRFEV
jgi:ribosome-interacting GTPase 1